MDTATCLSSYSKTAPNLDVRTARVMTQRPQSCEAITYSLLLKVQVFDRFTYFFIVKFGKLGCRGGQRQTVVGQWGYCFRIEPEI